MQPTGCSFSRMGPLPVARSQNRSSHQQHQSPYHPTSWSNSPPRAKRKVGFATVCLTSWRSSTKEMAIPNDHTKNPSGMWECDWWEGIGADVYLIKHGRKESALVTAKSCLWMSNFHCHVTLYGIFAPLWPMLRVSLANECNLVFFISVYMAKQIRIRIYVYIAVGINMYTFMYIYICYTCVNIQVYVFNPYIYIYAYNTCTYH